jgi:hypothetical protein
MSARYILFGLIIFSFLSSSCITPEKETEQVIIEMDKKNFEKERSLWNEQNIKSYQYTYEFFSDGYGPIGPLRITVRENEKTIIESEFTHEEHRRIMESIDEIYEFISGTIEDMGNKKPSYSSVKSKTLEITYDANYHYPTKAEFSVWYTKPMIGGDGYTIKVNNFTILTL